MATDSKYEPLFNKTWNSNETVTDSSSEIISESTNKRRRYMIIYNLDDKHTVFISAGLSGETGGTAEIDKGIPIRPDRSFIMDANNITFSPIHAIAKPVEGDNPSVLLSISIGTA